MAGKRAAIIQEFKKFISRGNVMDLAVGLVMGTAFTAIVKSLVNDLIMPLAGLVTGGVKFNSLKLVLRKATENTPELALGYGNFLQNIVDFLIISVVVFLVVRSFNHFRDLLEEFEKARHREEEEEAAKASAAAAQEASKASAPVEPPAPPALPADIALLTEIRDLLKKEQA